MIDEQIKLLLIEGKPKEAGLIQTLCAGASHIELFVADRLSSGLARLAQKDIDVVVLDLRLPDAQGLKAFQSVFDVAPKVPIIVTTGPADQESTLAVLEAGARDYLIKGQIDDNTLLRSVRYVLERQRLLDELEKACSPAAPEPPKADEAEEGPAPAPLRAPSYQSTRMRVAAETLRLREFAADAFAGLVRDYAELVALAVKNRGRTGRSEMPKRLCLLAEKFGNLHAAARDVLEVHRTALEALPPTTEEDIRASHEEGHFLVLELMGQLVSYYRG